jgi:predicted metal-dependent hydrolase
MTTLEIHDTKGRLTSYGLSCGFIERKQASGVSVTLWREHACYHVRMVECDTARRIFWFSFRTLGDARRHYDKANPSNLAKETQS